MCNIYVCTSSCLKRWWLFFCITVYSSHYDLVSGTSPTWRHAYPFIRYEKLKLETRSIATTELGLSREEGSQRGYEAEQGWMNSERADYFSTNCWSPRKRLMRWGACSWGKKALLEAGERVAVYTKPICTGRYASHMWQITDTDCGSVEYAACSLDWMYPKKSTVANRPLSVPPVTSNIILEIEGYCVIAISEESVSPTYQSWLALPKICYIMYSCQYTVLRFNTTQTGRCKDRISVAFQLTPAENEKKCSLLVSWNWKACIRKVCPDDNRRILWKMSTTKVFWSSVYNIELSCSALAWEQLTSTSHSSHTGRCTKFVSIETYYHGCTFGNNTSYCACTLRHWLTAESRVSYFWGDSSLVSSHETYFVDPFPSTSLCCFLHLPPPLSPPTSLYPLSPLHLPSPSPHLPFTSLHLPPLFPSVYVTEASWEVPQWAQLSHLPPPGEWSLQPPKWQGCHMYTDTQLLSHYFFRGKQHYFCFQWDKKNCCDFIVIARSRAARVRACNSLNLKLVGIIEPLLKIATHTTQLCA